VDQDKLPRRRMAQAVAAEKKKIRKKKNYKML